jgi:hypothetical protein
MRLKLFYENIDYVDCPRVGKTNEFYTDRIIGLKSVGKPAMDDVHVALLGHDENQFSTFMSRPYLSKVNLNEVEAGSYSGNEWAEARAIFARDSIFRKDAKFVGTVTASWHKKYEQFNQVDELENWEWMQTLLKSDPSDGVILCADVHCPCLWFNSTAKAVFKKGKSKFECNAGVRHIQQMLGITIKCRNVPFSNQVITHRDIYNEYAEFMSRDIVVEAVHDAYDMTNHLANPQELIRVPAYYMECISTLFFSTKDDWNYIPNALRKKVWYKS